MADIDKTYIIKIKKKKNKKKTDYEKFKDILKSYTDDDKLAGLLEAFYWGQKINEFDIEYKQMVKGWDFDF